jgi:hypothetical protein
MSGKLSSTNLTSNLPEMTEMTTVNTLDFTGNGVTFLGMVGIVSTLIIVVSVFRSFGNSPLRK